MNHTLEWYSKIAEEFDRQYERDTSFKERYIIWSNLIEKYSSPNFTVLDIGCGTGIFSYYASTINYKVIGLDGNADMVEICKKKQKKSNSHNVSFVCKKIEDLLASEFEQVDLILCSSVLEYVEEISLALNIFSALLKEGGAILISMPNLLSLYRRIEPMIYKLTGKPEYYAHVRHVPSLKSFSFLLSQSGFKILEHQYYGKIPVLGLLAEKLDLCQYGNNLFVLVGKKV